MVNRIITFTILPCLIIALFLAFAGVEQVQFDNSYYSFMRNVVQRANEWSFKIPNIPAIPEMQNVSGFLVILNAFISFVNGLSNIINILIMLINSLISVLMFIISLVWSVVDFIDLQSLVRI